MKSAPIELVCVGNYGMCSVTWHEVLVNERTKRVGIICHTLPAESKRREQRLNYLRFEVPEGVVCSYNRYVSVKPQKYEHRWFRVQDGQFVDLGEVVGGTSSYADLYLSDYVSQGYAIISSNDPNIVKRHVETDDDVTDIEVIRQVRGLES